MAIRTHLFPEVAPVLAVGLSAIKTSDEQVYAWMGSVLRELPSISSATGCSLNDSFWAPATWEVAL